MNIALIGFMGVGKSQVGKNVAKELNYRFIDIDKAIENIVGISINDIFNIYGEQYFRDLETQVLSSISTYNNTVISTGGGILQCKKNKDVLRKNCFIIYLQASPNTIYRNIIKDKKRGIIRPLLGKRISINGIEKLLKEREEQYSFNDYEIKMDKKSIYSVVREIIDVLKEKEIYG